ALSGAVGEAVPDRVTRSPARRHEPSLRVAEAAVGSADDAVAEPFARLLPGPVGVVADLLAGLPHGVLGAAQGGVHGTVVDGQDGVEFADGERHGYLLRVREFLLGSGGGAKCRCRRVSALRRPRMRTWSHRQVRSRSTPESAS